jgi:hypothetical protein
MPRSLLLQIAVGAAALALFAFGCVHPPEDVKSALAPYQPGEPSNFHQGAEHRRPPVVAQPDAGATAATVDAAAPVDASPASLSDAGTSLPDAAPQVDAAVAPTAGGTS